MVVKLTTKETVTRKMMMKKEVVVEEGADVGDVDTNEDHVM